MAIESLTQRVAGMTPGRDKEELLTFLAQLVNGLQALAAKLDADVGVTDTNYAATLAQYITD